MQKRTEFAQLWKPGFGGIELFQAKLWRHAFVKHFHDAYTIGLNESGQGQCFYRGRLVSNPAGSFNLINPGEVHTGQATDNEQGWGFRNFYISVPLMASLLTQLAWTKPELPCFSAPNVCSPALRSLFCQVFQVLDQPAPLLSQQSLLLELLAQLLLQQGTIQTLPTAQESKAVATVRAYLEEHAAENISIATLSQLTNLSGYYLIRSFRQQWGLPPHRYQHQLRLLKAKQALETAQPLAAIALEAGFYDQSHFTRSFKRVFGLTPGHYRQRNFVQDC
ncbi:MAG: helix-turn-helix domain-containing protein [Almyronema sp.]